MWIQSSKSKSERRIKQLEYWYKCHLCDTLDRVKRHVYTNIVGYNNTRDLKRMDELLDMIALENKAYQ